MPNNKQVAPVRKYTLQSRYPLRVGFPTPCHKELFYSLQPFYVVAQSTATSTTNEPNNNTMHYHEHV